MPSPDRPKVTVLTNAFHQSGRDDLADFADVDLNHMDQLTGPDQEERIIDVLQDSQVAVLGSKHRFTRKVITALSGLLAVRIGVGYDAIDMTAAAENNFAVTVSNPDLIKGPVANHTHFLVQSAACGIAARNAALLQNDSTAARDIEYVNLDQTSVGIIGIGKIGFEFAKLMQDQHGANIKTYDPGLDNPGQEERRAEVLAIGAERVDSIEEIFKTSDVISIHCGLGPNKVNRNIVTADHVRSMKPGTILVNADRGELFSEEAETAIADRVQTGEIRFAADVASQEPPQADHPYHSLIESSQITFTSHIAIRAALKPISLNAVAQIRRALIKKKLEESDLPPPLREHIGDINTKLQCK